MTPKLLFDYIIYAGLALGLVMCGFLLLFYMLGAFDKKD